MSLLNKLGRWWGIRRKLKQEKALRIRYLCGLPVEAKAVLINYYLKDAHTLLGDPDDQAVAQLISNGILYEGAPSRWLVRSQTYIRMDLEIWEIIRSGGWESEDPSVSRLMSAALEEGQETDQRRT